nr:QWxxN domain [Enterococcus sp. DIV1271a]
MLAYMENKPSPVPINEPFTPFWYDQEVFGQRSETDRANEKIRQAVCEKYSELCAVKEQPLNDFFLALQSWANRGGSNHELLEKRQQLAKIILSAYGLSAVQVSAIRAINIFFNGKQIMCSNHVLLLKLRILM